MPNFGHVGIFGNVPISNESYEQFWAQLAREFLIWHSPFTSILNDQIPFYKWFEDGMLNVI